MFSAGPAAAKPTVWALARTPNLARTAEVMESVERHLLAYENAQDVRPEFQPPDRGASHVREARRLLEEIHAETSADPMVRYRYAQVLYELADYKAALNTYASVAHSPHLGAPFRASALSALGTCYAHVERRHDEIIAYTEALQLTMHGAGRANILANRAEAYMAIGDLESAVRGYRESLSALSSLSALEMAFYSITTLWGLGVALDRTGDMEGAMRSIELARQYDPLDRQLNRPTWFFAPAYDEAWYRALGHWHRARSVTTEAARAIAYLSAIDAWRRYIEYAPDADPYKALAAARLSACEKESAQAAARSALGRPVQKAAGGTSPSKPLRQPNK